MSALAKLSAAAWFMALPAFADVPEVVADIPPVASLVAQVMQGIGAPDLLLQPGSSPHGHQMRPSEAAALSRADLVVWIGAAQSPWLKQALDQLAAESASLPLLEVPGTHLRLFGFQAHEDADGEDGHDHESPDHDEAPGDPHIAHVTGDGHAHHGVDTHAWLDPRNAVIWLNAIAQQLSVIDPDHATQYTENAKAAQADIMSLDADIRAEFDGVTGAIVTYHDAYGYFTDYYGIRSAGTVTDGTAAHPGAKRMAELRSRLEALSVQCLFTEPQFDASGATGLASALGLRSGQLDPVGSTLAQGPDLYRDLLRLTADTIAGCLKEE
ncbi:zinc ABC transporter substrate-binding protein [Pseudooceanicola sp. C21-150M6]|uniref:zinc ABC transporter substrate-binding protein n=1 Tax=Pseudooceanicola sp. C21-150M6 TaxID=3434355 RepID=UPI003D7FC408